MPAVSSAAPATRSSVSPVAPASGSVAVRAAGVRKSYRMGEATVQVLRGVDLTVNTGEFVAIEGRSGSGKSTLLHLLGALDVPDAGTIDVDGRDLAALSAGERARVRNARVGFVFQFYHLLPELNVLENVLLVPMVAGSWWRYRAARRDHRSAATESLTRLGLGHRLRHKPSQLSGGERQRVAIARAIMAKPSLLLLDEPTGNLDADTGRQIMEVLEALHRSAGQTMVMVTHDRSLAKTADRSLVLKQGRIVGE